MFALIFALAAVAVAPADGTYTYAASVGGSSMGQTTISVRHDATGVRLDENGAATVGGDRQSAQTQLLLDSSLAPASYTATYHAMGRTANQQLAFHGNTATESGDLGQNTYTLPAGASHFAVLDGTMFAGFFTLPAQMHAWGTGASVVALAPMFGRSYPLAFDTAATPARPSNVPAADVSLNVSKPVGFTLWYNPTTFIVDELVVPSQNALVIRR